MKSPVFFLVPLAVLLAGCTTPGESEMAQRQTRYHKPLTSPGAKFGALPQIVQLTVLAQVGPEEVVDAVRDTSSGRVVYKIYFRDSEIFPPLYVAPDGSVLNPPAPRPLDRFLITIADGLIAVDTGQPIERDWTTPDELVYAPEVQP